MIRDKFDDKLLFPLSLFLLTIITRIPFRSKFLYHMDSVHFALGLEKFDVTLHQPHPPGSFLYVMLGKFLHIFISDANSVFVTISIIFSGLAIATIYILAEKIFDRKTALFAAAIAISSPNLWLHGEVALTYIVEAFFSVMIAFLCWDIYTRQVNPNISAIILGIAGGIRPYTLLFLFPLWLFSVRRLQIRKICFALFLTALTCIAWSVPMIYATGGLEAYTGAYRELLFYTVYGNSVFERGWVSFKLYSSYLFLFSVYGLGAGIFTLSVAAYSIIRRNRLKSLDKKKLIFFSLWILPSLLFYLFAAIAVPGHALIFLPPLIILTAVSVVYLSNELRDSLRMDLSAVIISIIVIANGSFFLFSNYPVSYRDIKDHDRGLLIMLNGIRAHDPTKTAVFVVPYMFYGYRHIMYYLPDYRVYDVDLRVAKNGEARKVFWGFKGRSFLTKDIVLPQEIDSFVSPFLSEDSEGVKKVNGLNVERLYPTEIYLASGPISRITEVYPQTNMHLKLTGNGMN